MKELLTTYDVTISEEELDIISEMVEYDVEMEGAVVSGILEQILDQAKAKAQQIRYLLLGEEEFDEEVAQAEDLQADSKDQSTWKFDEEKK
jgi:hypothetical protein